MSSQTSAAVDLAAGRHSARTPALTHADVDRITRPLVADLHKPQPAIFWADMLLSAALGWSAFSVAVAARHRPAMAGLFFALAVVALYRGLCFTHEITHLRGRALPGFEAAWNVLLGLPLMLPSFTYVGVHQAHHSLSTYGTKDDPEYLPLGRSRKAIVAFSIQSAILLPVLLVVRFLLLAPVGLIVPRLHRWLETHASSFAMNPEYQRRMSGEAIRSMRRWEAALLGFWAAAGLLFYAGVVPAVTFAAWLALVTVISLVNTMRVLGAHDYESDGTRGDRAWQLQDSIDTPGGLWTELWAPVGLRYHALHHYFPGIPYHNLGTAYRRIMQALPPSSPYEESTSPSLQHSLRDLHDRARARECER